MLSAQQMCSLPKCFETIPDPRRRQGRKHSLATVLGLAAGGVLCGMHGYKAIHTWVKSLGQKALRRFDCRYENGRYVAPSEFVIRDCLVRVPPDTLERALTAWNQAWGLDDSALAIDGKTMKNAVDADGHQTHVVSVIGHESNVCHSQKK